MVGLTHHQESIRWVLVFLSCMVMIEIASAASPAKQVNATVGSRGPDSAPYHGHLGYMKLHGLFMWVSTGLFLPSGVIIIRMIKDAITDGASGNRIQTLVYAHMVIQTVGVIFSVAGGAIALNKFGKMAFHYTHERLGLSLLLLTWLLPVSGLLRPHRGSPARSFWYAFHWLAGTATIILSFINIYIGFHVYELITSKSLRTENILFSIQLSFMGLVYLMQDRWRYVREQGTGYAKPIASTVAR